MKSFVDLIKPYHLAWTLRLNGCSLTEEQIFMLKTWDNSTGNLSPSDLILNNNTADIKPSDIIEFLNNE